MIQLVLSSAPLDEVPGKLALATFFEDIRPLRGSTGLIDWRLNGRLSELILQGRLSGSFEESMIMPVSGRLAADEILLFGLGTAADLSEDRVEAGFARLMDKLCRLRSPVVVLSLGDLADDFMRWRSLLRTFMNQVNQKMEREDLQIICAEDERWIQEAKRRNMDFGMNVELTYA
ncbi:MAG: hypothetical protein HYY44_09225 [Deltaproteobacteria bacterium]|nr:hypothetical protein [Deltaproteobacteria bacterium]